MKKNRFLIFAAALAVFLFSIGCGNVTQKVKSFVSIDAFNIHQVITKDSATSRTIMWQSNTEEKDAYVEYRKNKMGAATQMQKERINDKFTDDGKTTWVHTVTLNNLDRARNMNTYWGHFIKMDPAGEYQAEQGKIYGKD